MNCKANIDDLQSPAYVFRGQMASRTVELSCNIPFLLRLQITRYRRVSVGWQSGGVRNSFDTIAHRADHDWLAELDFWFAKSLKSSHGIEC
jgi:hypothetical protein